MLFLLLLLATPDPTHTPGLTRPMTTAEVCAVTWGTDRRRVTVAMKRQVFAWYGVPQAERKNYEVDHLIPRSAGGADDVRNLWPQPWPEARRKDRLEARLHRDVCVTKTRTLGEAQRAFRDWAGAYQTLFGTAP